jgi:hypothetical protein
MIKKTNRKSFILYLDSLEVLDDLDDSQVAELFRAIVAYQKGDEITLSKIVKIAFLPIKQYLERDGDKYSRFVESRRENGKKGGRPKKPRKPSGLSRNLDKPKKAVNDNVNVNVNDTDNVNILSRDEVELQKVVGAYNQTFQKSITSTKGFEKNYRFWKQQYSTADIISAIQNARVDKFWRDKMTLTILFRQKNSNGEAVDYIQDLNNRSQQNLGNIAVL